MNELRSLSLPMRNDSGNTYFCCVRFGNLYSSIANSRRHDRHADGAVTGERDSPEEDENKN